MLLKHSWAEGRLGRKQNDTFTKTQLDTNEGLAYNQQIYRKLHHSYGKTFRKFDIDRNDDTKLNIHIDNNAYNTLLIYYLKSSIHLKRNITILFI